jgi:hypothetical protein
MYPEEQQMGKIIKFPDRGIYAMSSTTYSKDTAGRITGRSDDVSDSPMRDKSVHVINHVALDHDRSNPTEGCPMCDRASKKNFKKFDIQDPKG